MSSIIPYLYFDGNCEEAMNFYQSVLGGQIPYVGRYSDMPPSEDANDDCKQSPEDANRIMHMSLQTGDGGVILASDVPSKEMPGFSFKPGNNIAMSVNATSRAHTEEVFNGLSQGGTVTMPLQDTFWGAYFGMWTDKFGINWMVNYDDPAKMQK